MTLFYFDLCNGDGWLADPEGVELADEAVARSEALTIARGLMASEIREIAVINLAHYVSVRLAEDREIVRVYYRDAVRIHDTPPQT